MFYLKEFFKILKSNLLLSTIFVLSSLTLLTISGQQVKIKKLLSLKKQSSSGPYFNAIVSKNDNIDSVIRRMKNLPGVVSVEKHGASGIQAQISNLKKKFGADVINNLAAVNYKRVKVEVEDGLNAGSLNLIKEYMARLIGKDSVKIGGVKQPNGLKVKKNAFLYKFLTFFDVYAQIVLGGLWLISTFLILISVRRKAFIIEKFQRKSNTSLKIMLSGFGVLSVLTLLLNQVFLGQFQLISLVIVSLMAIIITLGTLFIKSRF